MKAPFKIILRTFALMAIVLFGSNLLQAKQTKAYNIGENVFIKDSFLDNPGGAKQLVSLTKIPLKKTVVVTEPTALRLRIRNSLNGDDSFSESRNSTDSIYYSHAHNTRKLPVKTTFASCVELLVEACISSGLLNENTWENSNLLHSFKHIHYLLESKKVLSIVFISSNELVFTSKNGLFYYNIPDKEFKSIIEGMEFSEQPIYFSNGILHAENNASIVYLSYADIMDILHTPLRQEHHIIAAIFYTPYMYLFLLVILLTSFYFSKNALKEKIKYLCGVSVKHDKNTQSASGSAENEQSDSDDVSVTEIENYIKRNLAIVSVSNICDYFEMSSRSLYTITAPKKPGALISELRRNKLKTLLKTKATNKEAAKLTGFSVHYIKKIKTELRYI